MSEAVWEERLDESVVRLEPEVTADVCAERYDVDDHDDLEELTNAALRKAFDAGFGSISLEDLDAAADDLGVVA
ncbi:hypothetical protein [Natrinema soli]|uniref:Uncharacterized protein n=1 Tax=Natrinema soli TaxID=1930624 RepID=A0ABD5SJC6_9EURY|nr:hypothetical protein [Natrinema soli]